MRLRWFLSAILCALVLLPAACGEDLYFESVLAPQDSRESGGPHAVEAWVVAGAGVARCLLRITSNPAAEGVRYAEIPLEIVTGTVEHGLWRVEFPGQPPGTQLFYYLTVVDRVGLLRKYPAHAPADNRLLVFRVLP